MGGQLFKWFGSLTYWGFLRLQTFNCLLKINFLLKKINCRHLNEEILANEISSFKFPRKVFLKRKLTIRFWLPKIVFLLGILLKKWFQIPHHFKALDLYNMLCCVVQWYVKSTMIFNLMTEDRTCSYIPFCVETHLTKRHIRTLWNIYPVDKKTSLRCLKDVLWKHSRHLGKISFRHLENVGFANLEDILHSYLKDISCTGM